MKSPWSSFFKIYKKQYFLYKINITNKVITNSWWSIGRKFLAKCAHLHSVTVTNFEGYWTFDVRVTTKRTRGMEVRRRTNKKQNPSSLVLWQIVLTLIWVGVFLSPPCWFSQNDSKTVQGVKLVSWSIK